MHVTVDVWIAVCHKQSMMENERTESIIAGKAAEVARLRQDLQIAEAELRGMEMMRNAVSTSGHAALATHKMATSRPLAATELKTGYRGGRQPGAISSTWRAILSEIYWLKRRQALPVPATSADVIQIAQGHGISLRPADVANRMQHYSKFGYVMISDGGFDVTKSAAQKFGFEKGPLMHEAPANAGAPNNPSLTEDQNGTALPAQKGGIFD